MYSLSSQSKKSLRISVTKDIVGPFPRPPGKVIIPIPPTDAFDLDFAVRLIPDPSPSLRRLGGLLGDTTGTRLPCNLPLYDCPHLLQSHTAPLCSNNSSFLIL
jgi:hypothetical protein